MSRQFDVVVIGSGPGGEGAAMKAAKEGRRVAVVDAHDQIGGFCTHRGTIPSKALRHGVQYLVQSPFVESTSFPKLIERALRVIPQQVAMRRAFYQRNRVEVIHGHASFLDPHTIQVALRDGGREQLSAKGFVIATGSRPYHPDDVNFKHPRVFDSDSILQMDQTPQIITVYGAGVVGCEYASIFRSLGMKVNLINQRSQLLTFLDDEIIDALAYHLRDQGVVIRNDEAYESVEPGNDGVRVHLKSKKVIYSDVLFWAQGRTSNSDHMGVDDALGLETSPQGWIKVNEHYQTAHPHIYAVGDVVGYPNLASAAYDQGRFAATHMIHGECEQRLIQDIPAGIYTIPEISSVGQTERDLTRKKIPYEVGHSFFKHLARAQITGQTTGMLKLLFHRDTLEILGIHCLGAQASEIIHIGQAIMAQDCKANNVMYFTNTTFNYPTMAEAYRVAALNGLNRLK